MDAPRLLYTYQDRIQSSNPAWVPSGKRIVLIDGVSFVIVDLEGSLITHVPFNGPALPFRLSSSSEGMVFESQHGDSSIWAISSFGTQLYPLASGGFPKWSPQGGAIAFVGKIANHLELLVMRAAGIPFWSVAKDCGSSSSIDWSPLGNQLVFAGPDNIRIANIDGSDIHDLVPGEWWSWGRDPEWSPRGNLIAYGQRSAESHVFVVDLDGSLVHKYQGFEKAVWSPNGGQLLCTNATEIHIFDIETGNQRFIAKGRLPSWSPSGEQIMFGDEGSVYIANV